MADKKTNLSTDPYKGVRDFYPEDQAIQNYIFDVWRKTARSFGYEEYSASILEPSELYRSKTSEEIVDEQTYTFTDRGGREVTLRPEMTPTVARMVAGKHKEYAKPIRWFSMPNLFRYERPQRGRLREHWQLNVDIFGISERAAEVEIILVAHSIMKNFGMKDENFEIKLGDRRALEDTLQNKYKLASEQIPEFMRLLDKKEKIENFDERAQNLLGAEFRLDDISSPEADSLIEELREIGVKNAVFDPTIVRGFDYYDGVVFEIFDKDPENNRSLFGGGRYNGLLSIFGEDNFPAVGFGMGDVTIKDTLESYGLLPDMKQRLDLYVCTLSKEYAPYAQKKALELREKGLAVEVNLSDDKVSTQIKKAEKDGAKYVICVGENEIKSKEFSAKELATGEESTIPENKLASFIQSKKE